MDEAPHLAAPRGGQPRLHASVLQQSLAGVRAGRRQSLAELYDATGAQVFALAQRVLGDRQLAEDVVLDVYLQIWRRASTYDAARGRPLGWILTIARSRALDALRSRRIRQRHESELARARPERDAIAAPPERVSQLDRQSRVALAIGELPPEQARAVELAFFEGLSHTEISARLGISLGTIKTRLRLGMVKLRDKLKRFEDEA